MTGQGLHFSLSSPCRRRVGQDSTLPTHMLLLGDRLSGSGPLAAEAPLTTAAQRFYHILHVAASAGEHEKVVQVTVQPPGSWGFLTRPATDGHARFSGAEPKEKLVDPALGRPLEGAGSGRTGGRQEWGWPAGVVWWDLCVCPWGSS